MSRRRRVHPRTIAQLAVAALAITAIAVTLGWLHRTRPTISDDFVVPGATDQRGGDLTTIVCERRLPGRAEVSNGGGAQGRELGLLRSSEAVACPDQFDGRTVEFIGEVVGDVLERDAGAWVLLNDDTYGLETGPLPAHTTFAGTNTGLSVWFPDEVLRGLEELDPGRPGRRGDVVAVRGRLLRADPADGGGMTLRVVSAELIAPAISATPPVHEAQAIAAAVLAGLAAAATAWARYERR